MITLDDLLQELVSSCAVPSNMGSVLDRSADLYNSRVKKPRKSKKRKPELDTTIPETIKLGEEEFTEEEVHVELNDLSRISYGIESIRKIPTQRDDGSPEMSCKEQIRDIWVQLNNMENYMLMKAPIYRLMHDLKSVNQFNPKSNYPALNKFTKKTYNQYDQGAVVLAVLKMYQEWSSTSAERAFANIYAWMNMHNKRGLIELHQDFAQGNSKKARTFAVNLYTDCLLAAGDFVKQWNQSEKISKSKRNSRKNGSTTSNSAKLVPNGKNTGGD